jgi:hypothetical protein
MDGLPDTNHTPSMARPSALTLVLLGSLGGCYQSHGPGRDGGRLDGGSRCAPGTYETSLRFTASSPPGCLLGDPGIISIGVPPTADDLFGGCGSDPGTITEIAPCEWAVDTQCLIPDASSTFVGTVEVHDGAVHGRIEMETSGFGGACRVTMILGD